MSTPREAIAEALSELEVITGDGSLTEESEEWNVAVSVLAALESAGFTVAKLEHFANVYEAKGYEGEWWVTDSPPEVEGIRWELTRCEPLFRVLPVVPDLPRGEQE